MSFYRVLERSPARLVIWIDNRSQWLQVIRAMTILLMLLLLIPLVLSGYNFPQYFLSVFLPIALFAGIVLLPTKNYILEIDKAWNRLTLTEQGLIKTTVIQNPLQAIEFSILESSVDRVRPLCGFGQDSRGSKIESEVSRTHESSCTIRMHFCDRAAIELVGMNHQNWDDVHQLAAELELFGTTTSLADRTIPDRT